MSEYKMELMDWKNIERQSEQQVRDSLLMRVVAEVLLKEACENIKRLGGKTIDEENRIARAEAQRQTDAAKSAKESKKPKGDLVGS
jgi:hypothetical protein